MDGATIHPVAPGDVGHTGAGEHLPDREVALLNHGQLREHLQILLGSVEPQ
jgi:hypothetical protein